MNIDRNNISEEVEKQIRQTVGGISPKSLLASDLQDMHHYAARVVGETSTFEGDSEFSGLRGRLNAYEALYGKMAHWEEAFNNGPEWEPGPFCGALEKIVGVPEDETQMVACVRVAQAYIAFVGDLIDVDPYSGTGARYRFLVPDGTAYEKVCASDDDAFQEAHAATDNDRCVVEKKINGEFRLWDTTKERWAVPAKKQKQAVKQCQDEAIRLMQERGE